MYRHLYLNYLNRLAMLHDDSILTYLMTLKLFLQDFDLNFFFILFYYFTPHSRHLIKCLLKNEVLHQL